VEADAGTCEEHAMVAIHYTGGGAAARSGVISRSLTQATFAALGAPSVLDTQPWRWRINEDSVGLCADWARQVPDVDPDGRLLLISCGAALHHARVALAADRVGVDVVRLPDPGDPALLTELRYTGPIGRLPRMEALHRAIAVRRSDQRSFADRPVPGEELALLRAAAEQVGAGAYTVTGRDLPASPTGDATYVVITTPGATTADWLTAGEGLSAVLLTATAAGLASSASELTAITSPAVTGRTRAAGRFPAVAVRVGVASRLGTVREARRPTAEESA
jgi:hypothetical protein